MMIQGMKDHADLMLQHNTTHHIPMTPSTWVWIRDDELGGREEQ
jgi:hypothetical protein